jgi:CubicO group peptidase (beta-lactamase class C family)
VHSTVEDLATWDNALAAGTVVKPASLAQMWTPVTLQNGLDRPYGFGWEVKQERGHRLITHNGVTGTEYSRFPDDELTVIVLTNLGRRPDTSGADPYGLTLGVARLLIPERGAN